ncbi:MAG: phosphatidylglycerol lysyltransferase domain-containing protein, partial [bacterium]
MIQIQLPHFPEFTKLEINDYKILQAYFDEIQPEISDQNFTNLFLWRDFYDIRITNLDQNTCLYCASPLTPEKEFFFQPFGDKRILDTIETCLKYLKAQDKRPIIRRASEKFVKDYLNDQTHLLVQKDKDSSDYVYLAENLIRLQGRRYDGHRNHIKRFKENYANSSIEF